MKTCLMIVAVLSFAISFGAPRALTPTPWNGEATCWQMKRHLEKMTTITNGGAKVVFIGDSITHFWESYGKEQRAKYFSTGDMKMLNLGTSADRTEHVLWRLTEGKELDGYEAKVIFVMIGTNNTGHFKEPPADTILGIREILKVIQAKQPKAKIVLTAIFPRGKDRNDELRLRNEIVNKEISKFADGETIFWLDFNDQFLTIDGRLSGELFPDFLHPHADGYELWAAAALPYAQAAVADQPMPPNRFASFVRAENRRIDSCVATYPVSRIRREGYGVKDWWLDRFQRNRNQITEAKGAFDLVFFGDSITHNWENQGKESFAELQKTYSILNIGYSGDRTENLLWRGENGELDGYNAKCIMLMIGTNNTWHNRDKPEDIARGIKKILEMIARKQPAAKTLLVSIFPFGDKIDHPHRVNNEKANEIIKSYADGKKVIWVDFNEKFLDEKGNTVKWMPDLCHPNAAGYKEIWLPAVLPHFKEIVGK